MKLLITGGAGFIGCNLARYALNMGHVDEVRIIDDLSTGLITNLEGLPIEFCQASILDYQTLTVFSRGVDAIVHLAAIPSVPRSIANPVASHQANATGTLNVLEAARENSVGQVIVASSSSVYGANTAPKKNEYDWTRPMSPYAVSKQATESYACAYEFAYGLKTLAFRFFNVYGPYQTPDHAYAAVIPRFLDAALRGVPVEICGDGLQSRDFTYVDTVCEIVHDALARRVHSTDPVNLALGTNTNLLELLERIERELGTTVDRRFISPRVGDVRRSSADPSRLRELFPDVEGLDLNAGLHQTASWLRKHLVAEGRAENRVAKNGTEPSRMEKN
ncbi:MAG: NAD-dependent epimerase/dehydratase family protein [Propionibacteriaceae bacterium]|nr:NAD-dependent epimerase/dehydratase family protein [Propionibacteriaceae bacterium]